MLKKVINQNLNKIDIIHIAEANAVMYDPSLKKS